MHLYACICIMYPDGGWSVIVNDFFRLIKRIKTHFNYILIHFLFKSDFICLIKAAQMKRQKKQSCLKLSKKVSFFLYLPALQEMAEMYLPLLSRGAMSGEGLPEAVKPYDNFSKQLVSRNKDRYPPPPLHSIPPPHQGAFGTPNVQPRCSIRRLFFLFPLLLSRWGRLRLPGGNRTGSG